jgi:hypothetical protein
LSGDHVPELQDEDKQWWTYSFDQIRGRLTGDGSGQHEQRDQGARTSTTASAWATPMAAGASGDDMLDPCRRMQGASGERPPTTSLGELRPNSVNRTYQAVTEISDGRLSNCDCGHDIIVGMSGNDWIAQGNSA